jgi:hypothetical protein
VNIESLLALQLEVLYYHHGLFPRGVCIQEHITMCIRFLFSTPPLPQLTTSMSDPLDPSGVRSAVCLPYAVYAADAKSCPPAAALPVRGSEAKPWVSIPSVSPWGPVFSALNVRSTAAAAVDAAAAAPAAEPFDLELA